LIGVAGVVNPFGCDGARCNGTWKHHPAFGLFRQGKPGSGKPHPTFSFRIDFGFGVIPVDEEGQKFCSEVVEHIIGLGGDKLTYWLGSFWLNISRGIDPDKEQLTFK
jgi:hypothetical protein